VINRPLPEEDPETPVGVAVQLKVEPDGVELRDKASAVPVQMVVTPLNEADGLGFTVTKIEIAVPGQPLAVPETLYVTLPVVVLPLLKV
jgi:hypothetical protein